MFLHIGTHKTGTTSTQQYLSTLQAELLAEGILYPTGGRPEMAPTGHHLLAWSVSRALQEKWGKVDDHCWTEVLDEIDTHDPAITVLSAEGFSILTEAEVARVRAYTRRFDVTVIVYLRNPLGFMVSQYKQQIKLGKSCEPFRAFMEGSIVQCNYPALLKKWTDCFGRDNIVIRLYDEQKHGWGIKRDFMHILGVESEALEKSVARVFKKANVSPDDDAIQVIRFLNSIEGKHTGNRNTFVHKLRRSLVRERTNYVGKTLLAVAKPFLKEKLYTAQDVLWLRQETAPWNEALFDTYLLDENGRSYLAF